MSSIIVKLDCITNMHVGNGDVNYNIIDNEVERDPVTGFPTINASGVKGALREYFNSCDAGIVDAIFGGSAAGNNTPGRLKILCADMLAMPIRASKGKEAYYKVTTEAAVNLYNEKSELFGDKTKLSIQPEAPANSEGEGIKLKNSVNLDGEKIYVVGEDEFRTLSLPVVARNKLNNGISENLWYEEIVPHRSIFTFAVAALDNDDELLKKFIANVNGKIVQFGGNATIGYGLCKASVKGGGMQ